MVDPADMWRGIHHDVERRDAMRGKGSVTNEPCETFDWMTESAICVDGRPLRDRSCDEILRRDSDFNDPDDDRYNQELLWDNQKRTPNPISLPARVIKIIRKEKRKNGYRVLSEPVRKLILHGLTDHNFYFGDELHKLNQKPSIQRAIEDCNRDIMDKLDQGVKCSDNCKRCTSVRLNEDLYELIDEAMNDAGICSPDKFLGYLVIRSLSKHTTYEKQWHMIFNPIIEDMQRQLKNYINKLKKL